MLRALGRVTPAPVRRFDDKPPAAVALQTLDISDWLAAMSGDAFNAATVTCYPSGLTFGAVSQSAGVLSWLASGGAAATDYLVFVSYTSTSGRAGYEIWTCLVPDPFDAAAGSIAAPVVDLTTFTAQMQAFLATLPSSSVGLSSGSLWNNGGILAIA